MYLYGCTIWYRRCIFIVEAGNRIVKNTGVSDISINKNTGVSDIVSTRQPYWNPMHPFRPNTVPTSLPSADTVAHVVNIRAHIVATIAVVMPISLLYGSHCVASIAVTFRPNTVPTSLSSGTTNAVDKPCKQAEQSRKRGTRYVHKSGYRAYAGSSEKVT